MSSKTELRRLNRAPYLLAAAMAALAGAPGTSKALNIDSWTGDAGNEVWSFPNNWISNSVPGIGDQATIYNSAVVIESTPPTVGGLLVGEFINPATLDTGTFKLNVSGVASVAGGELFTGAAPSGSFSLQAPTLNVSSGGMVDEYSSSSYIRVSSTTTGAANGTLNLDNTSTIAASGTIDAGTFTSNGLIESQTSSATINATTFTMAGGSGNTAIIESSGEPLTINATNFELHDFNSTINAADANSTITLNGSPDYTSGYIGANLIVGDTSSVTFSGAEWVFGYNSGGVSHGNVTLNGGPTFARAAQLPDGAVFETNVNVSGYASLGGGPDFEGGSYTTVASSSYLYLNSPYFRGNTTGQPITFTGSGVYEMNGATVIGDSSSGVPYTTVTVNAGTVFDWDGTSENNASCMITNGELDIYSSAIDVQTFFPLNHYGYDGALTVTGGASLNVAGTPWTLYGTMTLGPGALVKGQTITVNGSTSSVPVGSYSINPTFNGTNFPVIQAPLVLLSGSTIYMGFSGGSTGGLHLDGATTWAGGSVISAPYVNTPYGILVQDGNATVSGNTDIFCDVLDMDGTANTATWTINPNVTFTQQAFYLDSAGSSTNPFHSTLNINGGTISMQTNGGLWTLAGGTINLNYSGGSAAEIDHDKLVLGSGSVIGTINVGGTGGSYIDAPLQSAATSVAGGNVINVSNGSYVFVNNLGSDPNAVLTKTGPGKMLIVGTQAHSAGSQIIVSQGELDVETDAGAGGANLNLNASGGTTVLTTTQRLSTLTIGTGATVSITPVLFPNPRSVVVTSLNMNGGTFNIGDNDVIAHDGNLGNIWLSTQAGYSNGTWTGTGIDSSSAASDSSHLHAVGCILNKSATNTALYTSLEGQPAVTTDVLIRYTYYGDATLDGKVDGSDYSRIDAAYLADKNTPNSATGWFNGDFNYDGVINGSDYTLMDNAFNSQGAQLAAQVAAPTAEIAPSDATSAVPEPAAIGLIGLAAITTLSRRKRRPAF